MKDGNKALGLWRSEIDALDAELLKLLNQRAGIACEIAAIKVASGLPAYDPQRETQVLNKIAQRNQGPLDNESVLAVFGSIIRETRRLGTERMRKLEGVQAKTLHNQRADAIQVAESQAAHEQYE